MTRYKWNIITGRVETPGSAGQVFLELHGLDAGTTEVKLARLSFDPNGTESGIISVTSDLGDVQTGSLRAEGSTRVKWAVDAVSVMNLTDGRQWTANGAFFAQDGTFPLLRFEQTGDALDDEAGDPPGSPDKSDPGKTKETGGGVGGDDSDQSSDESSADGDSESQPNTSVLDALTKLQQTFNQVLGIVTQIQTLISDSGTKPGDKPRVAPKPIAFDVSPVDDAEIGTSLLRFRTFELFGQKSGQKVPLSQVLNCEKEGPCTLSPGARVMVTTDPSEGYGLGGQPGSWAKYAGKDTPADYGQDIDRGVLGWDGNTAWPIDSSFLEQIFGADWRTSIYG